MYRHSSSQRDSDDGKELTDWHLPKLSDTTSSSKEQSFLMRCKYSSTQTTNRTLSYKLFSTLSNLYRTLLGPTLLNHSDIRQAHTVDDPLYLSISSTKRSRKFSTKEIKRFCCKRSRKASRKRSRRSLHDCLSHWGIPDSSKRLAMTYNDHEGLLSILLSQILLLLLTTNARSFTLLRLIPPLLPTTVPSSVADYLSPLLSGFNPNLSPSLLPSLQNPTRIQLLTPSSLLELSIDVRCRSNTRFLTLVDNTR